MNTEITTKPRRKTLRNALVAIGVSAVLAVGGVVPAANAWYNNVSVSGSQSILLQKTNGSQVRVYPGGGTSDVQYAYATTRTCIKVSGTSSYTQCLPRGGWVYVNAGFITLQKYNY